MFLKFHICDLPEWRSNFAIQKVILTSTQKINIAIKKTLPSQNELDNLQKLPSNFVQPDHFFKTDSSNQANFSIPNVLLGFVGYLEHGPRLNQIMLTRWFNPWPFHPPNVWGHKQPLEIKGHVFTHDPKGRSLCWITRENGPLSGGNPADKDNFVAWEIQVSEVEKRWTSKVPTLPDFQTLPETGEFLPWKSTEFPIGNTSRNGGFSSQVC